MNRKLGSDLVGDEVGMRVEEERGDNWANLAATGVLFRFWGWQPEKRSIGNMPNHSGA